MKTLEELKQISKDYTSGPVVTLALKDAIRWIEAYRELGARILTRFPPMEVRLLNESRDEAFRQLDEEAKRIFEEGE